MSYLRSISALIAALPLYGVAAMSNPYASQLAVISSSVSAGSLSTPAAASAYGNLLAQASPTSVPTSFTQFQDTYKQIWGTNTSQSSDFMSASANMLANGAGLDGLQNYLPLGSVCPGINCDMNSNPPPKCHIYPKKSSQDAPYSLSEDMLREAIYIPAGFSYGATGKQPVLLVPGTGSFGGRHDLAETFWLNIPGAQLGDAQLAAEYTAYAINYMQCQSGRTIPGLSWSQGSLNFQWAFKYWPSSRANTTDVIAISPDYHGTIFANALCAALPCDPSVLQQDYNSKFIQTLRFNGGDSAYVPTTNVFSGFFDKIVEPQQIPIASGQLNDARNVGVSNTEVQISCAGQIAGSLYGHETVLINPPAAALALDALQHKGPGQVSRINTTAVCANYIASPLTFEDFLLTEGLIPLAGYYLITYMPKSTVESPIMAYAA